MGKLRRWDGALAWWLVLASILLAGCTARWVAEYDQASVDRIGTAYERMDRMYESLIRADPADRTYTTVEAEWSAIATDLRAIALRQKTRADNAESQESADELVSLWDHKRVEHKARSASSPGDAYRDSLIALDRARLEAAFSAAMSAERFKQ